MLLSLSSVIIVPFTRYKFHRRQQHISILKFFHPSECCSVETTSVDTTLPIANHHVCTIHSNIYCCHYSIVTKFEMLDAGLGKSKERAKHFRTKHHHVQSLCPDVVTPNRLDVLMFGVHHFHCRRTYPSASRSRASFRPSLYVITSLVQISCPSTEAMQLPPSQTTSTLPVTVPSACSELSTVHSDPYCGGVHRSGRRRDSRFLKTNQGSRDGRTSTSRENSEGPQSHDC